MSSKKIVNNKVKGHVRRKLAPSHVNGDSLNLHMDSCRSCQQYFSHVEMGPSVSCSTIESLESFKGNIAAVGLHLALQSKLTRFSKFAYFNTGEMNGPENCISPASTIYAAYISAFCLPVYM